MVVEADMEATIVVHPLHHEVTVAEDTIVIVHHLATLLQEIILRQHRDAKRDIHQELHMEGKIILLLPGGRVRDTMIVREGLRIPSRGQEMTTVAGVIGEMYSLDLLRGELLH